MGDNQDQDRESTERAVDEVLEQLAYYRLVPKTLVGDVQAKYGRRIGEWLDSFLGPQWKPHREHLRKAFKLNMPHRAGDQWIRLCIEEAARSHLKDRLWPWVRNDRELDEIAECIRFEKVDAQ